MSLKVEKNGTVTFEIKLPWKDIKDKYDELLKQTAEYIEVKGFRKGKAPLKAVEKKVDKDKIYSQVLEKLLPNTYYKALKKHEITPVINPKINIVERKQEKPWIFKVTTAVKPEVKLGNYKSYVKSAVEKIKKEESKQEEKPKKKTEKTKSKSKNKKSSKKEGDSHDHDHDHKGEDPKLTAIFDSLLENAELKVSELMIQEETQNAISKLLNQLESMKISFEDYLKSIKKSQKELVEDYKKTAEERLKVEFILDAIINEEDPEVTKEELKRYETTKENEEYVKYLIRKQKIIDKLSEL